ncbi:MAG: metallophosphoesterase [Armatimonadetes bacterium]|nr:metallophosphoesterase [Armatimonadota bacterium]
MLVTLLQTSDLHGKLPPESAARLASLKAEAGVDFLVDSGDVVGAGNLGYRPHEPVWETFNPLGYTAMAVGNRDAHLWRSVFEKKVAPAACPVLCANLEVRAGRNPTRSHLIRETAEGVRVAFFGLTVPMITREMGSRHLSDLLFHPPRDVAKEWVPRLRKEADLVVLLSHLGLREDHRLAKAVPGIDLILGGHSHIELHRPDREGETAICQPGGFGRYATLVRCDREGREGPWNITGHLESLK